LSSTSAQVCSYNTARSRLHARTICLFRIQYTCCPNARLTENVFKRIPANASSKAQKRFRENEMTSFFGQVSTYRLFRFLRVKRNKEKMSNWAKSARIGLYYKADLLTDFNWFFDC